MFLREDVVEKSMSIWSGARASAALMSLGRPATRGAVRVTGNLLAFGRALSVIRVSHLLSHVQLRHTMAAQRVIGVQGSNPWAPSLRGSVY